MKVYAFFWITVTLSMAVLLSFAFTAHSRFWTTGKEEEKEHCLHYYGMVLAQFMHA
jgi:hypothetical protein